MTINVGKLTKNGNDLFDIQDLLLSLIIWHWTCQ